MTAYWLIQKFDLTIVYKKVQRREKSLSTFVNQYRNLGYVLMELDQPRLHAYQEAANQAFITYCEKKQDPNTATWLDIGTGPRMFLTQMLLKNPTTRHVHAVEANPQSFKQANILRESTPHIKQKVTLHEGYSSSFNWSKCNPPPFAIIHDVLGTVSTEEGCLQILRETMATFKNVSLCIPHEFGTLCMPVSRPSVSQVSLMVSKLFDGALEVIRVPGVQTLFNPPKNNFLCSSAQFVEKFESTNIPSETNLTQTITFTIETPSPTQFTGFYLGTYVLAGKNLGEGKGIIDGLKQTTNWGVKYIQMVDDEKKITVKQGDKIKVCFKTDLTHGCPVYRLEAWVNEVYITVIEF